MNIGWRRWLSAGLVGLLAVMALPPVTAQAHGGLAVSVPAQGATVSAPVESLTLTFTEKPASSATFTVTAPTGERVDGGWSHGTPAPLTKPVREYQLTNGVWEPMLYATGFPVAVTVEQWPASGTYVVRYQSIASDGDEVDGEVSFTYTGPATVKHAPGRGVWVWLVPLLVAVAGVLIYVLVRKRPVAREG
ncbi:copper resistance protein CopC [Actinoplanes sp. NPDC051859]|uniref:copper resistance protein CopC n=1 Tax=Actinoplanes sp. NPDC051859 TaxID=3363909 RepID=UPI0037B7D63E